MLKKLVPLMGIIVLLILPVSASQFPEKLPSITKEEAKSLGLALTYSGGSTNPNYVLFYQDFMCANHAKDSNNHVRVVVDYYIDNEAVEQFSWFIKTGENYTDREYEIRDDDGNVLGREYLHYEFNGGSNYADLRTVYGKEYRNGYKFVSIEHTYVALVNDHYWITAKAVYVEGTTACNLENLAPVLLNMYLERIPNGTVKVPVNSTGVSENSEDSSTAPGLSQDATKRMKNTEEKLKGLGNGWGGFVVIKTPRGDIIKVVNSKMDYTGDSSALGWKAKYYGNRALDAFIDKVADYLPKPVGLFKDYFKADKDINVFSDDEMVKKTAKDLHVDGKSASLYNGMSDIDNREKALTPYRNAVPSSVETKPIELILNSMGVAIKKTLAQDYRWEFEKTEEIALRYKRAGLKYRDIIRNTVEEMGDTTTGMHRVNMMNRNSKNDFRDQEARVRFYLNKLFEEGVI